MPYDQSSLFRLLYRSRSGVAGGPAEVNREIEAILIASRRNNREAGVTGALMFTRSLFVQALEGPAQAVETTFDRICYDLRHTHLEIVECGPILERGFGGWSMSHLVPNGSMTGLLDRTENEIELAEAALAAMKLIVASMKPPAQAVGELSGRPATTR